MAWWKAQCESRTNPKFATAGRDASWLWYCANCWAREQLTDGHIPKSMLASLVPGMSVPQVRRAVQALIDARLAHATTDGGFTIHDFLNHHPSKAKVKADREADSGRKRPLIDTDSDRKDGETDTDSEVPCTRVGDSPSLDSSVVVLSKPLPIKGLLALHEELFRHANNGQKPAKYTGEDAKHAKDLIEDHGEPKAIAIVRQAFVSTSPFIAKSGRSMRFIASSSVQNQLISELSGPSTAGDGFDGLREFVRNG